MANFSPRITSRAWPSGQDCYATNISANPREPQDRSFAMELSDSRNRRKRKFPNFMYGATFPKDTVGSGGAPYGGALDWMNKHQDYLNQSLKYVQKYPNLVQEKVMDPFWDFMEPLIHNNNLLVKYNAFIRTQFGLQNSIQLSEERFGQQLPTAATYFKLDNDTRSNDYTYPLRRAFFCYDRSSAHHEALKHLIVDQIEPFLSIRTNPMVEQAKVVNSLDVCRSICGAVFILLISDNVFRDAACLNLLSIAIAYKSPIIFLRESGYSLPAQLPDAKIAYVKVPEAAPFVPKHNTLEVNTELKQSLEHRLAHASVSDIQDEDEEDVGVAVLKVKEKKEKEQEVESQMSTSLAGKIKDLYKDSLIFNPQMFETTLAVLYDKLASYTGAAFPGTVPELATEAAAELSKPFNIGAMKLPERPLYKAGTARTTKGFHDTLKGETTTNSNNNSCDADSQGEELDKQPSLDKPQAEDEKSDGLKIARFL